MTRLLALLLLAALTAPASADDARARLAESRLALDGGDTVRAVRTASQAEELFRKAGDAAGEAQAANQAGLGHLARAEYAEALARFEHALAIDMRLGDGESEVALRNRIGGIRFYQGRYTEAGLAYRAALEKATRSAGAGWSLRRRQLTLINFGVLYEQLGEYAKALEAYRGADVSPSGLSDTEHAQLLMTQGGLHRRLQDRASALAAYAGARRRFERGKQVEGVIRVLHEIGTVNGAEAAVAEALRLSRQAGNARLEMLSRLLVAQALDRRPEFQAALEQARAAGAVEEQWTALVGIARIDDREGRKAEALAACREAIRLIESVRGGWRKPSLKPGFLPGRRDAYDLAIGIVLDAGKPDAADLVGLMEGARGRYLPEALREAAGRPTLAALQARLDERVLLVEYWMAQGRGAVLWMTRTGAGVASVAPAGKSLLAGLPLAGVRRVVVVPDGPLHGTAFEALDDGAGLLIRRAEVSYLPAAGLLLRPPRGRSVSAPWRVHRIEAGSKSRLSSDEAARTPVLRVAAHASIDLTDPNRSHLIFPPETGRPGSDRLYWGELLSLKLPAVELVTLAAPGAEHVRDLSRALLATGAASTLTPLWSVPEPAAAELLRRFHRELDRGESRAAALRTAKLAMLDSGGEFAQPRYWAAFVLDGESGRITPVAPWWWIAAGAGAALLAVLIAVRRRR